MATKTLASLDQMKDQLLAQKSVSELFKLASSDEFRTSARNLKPEELVELRTLYKSVQTSLDGRVKLEEFDGQILNVVDIDYWFSEEWQSEGITLHYRSEREPEKRYKSVTSSVVLVRFAKQFEVPPTEKNPVRVLVELVPVKDADRARQGQRIWKVKRLAERTEQGSMPF